MWQGAAAICLDEEGRLLMVLQGTPEEEKKWAVPSGGKESGETFESCCLRELKEETGYVGAVVRPLFVKADGAVEVQYFEVEVTGGCMEICDPDGLIHEIAWKAAAEIDGLALSFPEDLPFLLSLFEEAATSQAR
ncbi:ADP-ribose pyrophosphatase YjhB, NUDIX family [Bhargavaea ginsengi]|uniref:ADP-ribose pyrophosphatase YjhB, NUDIX family n=1 Tax=Bhargavaea ginsengi TaxID=426757 RepID=A0A1H6VBR8_9BACL|nr:NUDIX hydrolase [Bhargavaea ginsengi]SEI99257.1 ADP-ribose pyrophosphatase YjhB, NUDIX family [Bhargavaea ginsengi]